MTPKEFAHATMLVASLRTRLGHANALAAAVKAERDDLAKQLDAHVESLRLSNAQCAEYLRQNEQLRADVSAAATGLTQDISALVDAGTAEYNKLHSELVEVRAALASVTEQRDSLKRTIDEWERADTKPHARIDEAAEAAPVCMQCLKERVERDYAYETGPSVAFLSKPLLPEDVADHVAPPVLPFSSPAHENKNVCGIFGCDPKQHGPCPLKFTKLTDDEAISRTLNDALPLCMRKPAAEPAPVLPMCMTCHHCGNALEASVFGPYNVCITIGCPRTVTNNDDGLHKNPYGGPCHAGFLVRHE